MEVGPGRADVVKIMQAAYRDEIISTWVFKSA